MARTRKTRVFVSYSRHDEALVRPLAGLLGVAGGDAVFLDVSSLKPGELWEKEILGAVKEASVFVLCWCCACASSSFVAKEIGAAISSGEKKLVPVLFCSAPLPPSMAGRQWIDLRGKVVHDCPGPHRKKPSAQQKINRVRNPRVTVDDLEDPADPNHGVIASAGTVMTENLDVGVGARINTRDLEESFPAPAPRRPAASPPAAGILEGSSRAFPRPAALAGSILLARSWLETIRTRNERRQIEQVAARATSYFEGLGIRQSSGDANP